MMIKMSRVLGNHSTEGFSHLIRKTCGRYGRFFWSPVTVSRQSGRVVARSRKGTVEFDGTEVLFESLLEKTLAVDLKDPGVLISAD